MLKIVDLPGQSRCVKQEGTQNLDHTHESIGDLCSPKGGGGGEGDDVVYGKRVVENWKYCSIDIHMGV